jgi:predicted RNA-binding protein with TRAM domain
MYREEGRGRGGFGPREMHTVPVNVGDEVEVKIEAVGEKGDGVAKVKGFVLFVPGVKEGDFVKVRVTKVLRKVGFAEVIGQATGSPEKKKESFKEKEEEPEEQFAGEDSEDFGEEE